MSERAVKLFLDALEELRCKMDPQAGDRAETGFQSDEPGEVKRAAAFREDLVEVLGDEKMATAWDPENVAGEEVFTCLVFAAEAYLRGGDDDRRPYLRRMIEATRDRREDPGFIQRALPVLAEAPVERWEILAHGGIAEGAAKEAYEAGWPVTRQRIEETAHRLTRPDADPGASFHVKFLKEMKLVKVSRKPRLARDMTGDASDLWKFVTITDDGVRFLWMLGFG